ncbi:biotin/lipoyl-containing protein [Desulfoscipio geothermicus]|uniref:Biotin-requiring enzyme n=1 Tax=Desulfoscipio geothermicus DSM 3669 TaxID=1121426 RepID=A0A1I6CYF1_9FIRM|nr:biotin/lipoyl-containing protein [Desulfoscipio geothermicus]SFQ98111.1 Biotin-requiring enzyme [Desulfoscipio geothermicus DSM 3669]
MTQVNAPMVGKVLSVDVKVGDQVKKNDVLVTLEAMKMQIKVYAPADGEVAEVNCNAGDVVSTDTVVVALK